MKKKTAHPFGCAVLFYFCGELKDELYPKWGRKNLGW
jgi:hypothetical protein